MLVKSVLAITLGAGMLVVSAPADAQPGPSVTICHRTGAVSNPYVQVPNNSLQQLQQAGHTSHTGPVFPRVDANGRWGDIIPPIGNFPGLNWSRKGIDVWEAGCTITFEPPSNVRPTVTPIPTPTPTATPTKSPSPKPTKTPGVRPTNGLTPPPTNGPEETLAPQPSDIPDPTQTPTEEPDEDKPGATEPPGVTVDPERPGESELPPELRLPGNGSNIMPAEEAITIDPGDRVVLLGMLTTPERRALFIDIAEGVIPLGAPGAGLGGEAKSDKDSWLVAGWILLGLGGLAGGIAGIRRLVR